MSSPDNKKVPVNHKERPSAKRNGNNSVLEGRLNENNDVSDIAEDAQKRTSGGDGAPPPPETDSKTDQELQQTITQPDVSTENVNRAESASDPKKEAVLVRDRMQTIWGRLPDGVKDAIKETTGLKNAVNLTARGESDVIGSWYNQRLKEYRDELAIDTNHPAEREHDMFARLAGDVRQLYKSFGNVIASADDLTCDQVGYTDDFLNTTRTRAADERSSDFNKVDNPDFHTNNESTNSESTNEQADGAKTHHKTLQNLISQELSGDTRQLVDRVVHERGAGSVGEVLAVLSDGFDTIKDDYE